MWGKNCEKKIEKKKRKKFSVKDILKKKREKNVWKKSGNKIVSTKKIEAIF